MTTVDHPDVPRPLPVDRLAAEDTNWGRELSSALIRVGAGVLMVHNGLDKLVDPEGFAKFVVEPYLGFLPHDDPISYVTWTYLAAGAELAGAAGLTLGLWTRLCPSPLLHHGSRRVLPRRADRSRRVPARRRREAPVRV